MSIFLHEKDSSWQTKCWWARAGSSFRTEASWPSEVVVGGEENGLRQKRVEIGLNDIVMVSTLSDAKTSIFPFMTKGSRNSLWSQQEKMLYILWIMSSCMQRLKIKERLLPFQVGNSNQLTQLLHPSLEWESWLQKHTFAGFCVVMNYIFVSAYQKFQPILLSYFGGNVF